MPHRGIDCAGWSVKMRLRAALLGGVCCWGVREDQSGGWHVQPPVRPKEWAQLVQGCGSRPADVPPDGCSGLADHPRGQRLRSLGSRDHSGQPYYFHWHVRSDGGGHRSDPPAAGADGEGDTEPGGGPEHRRDRDLVGGRHPRQPGAERHLLLRTRQRRLLPRRRGHGRHSCPQRQGLRHVQPQLGVHGHHGRSVRHVRVAPGPGHLLRQRRTPRSMARAVVQPQGAALERLHSGRLSSGDQYLQRRCQPRDPAS
mmetsp:Transcript_94132/g.162788  ORF Transcript_94132/g.162788 Transcript_94132/m.162788 type:complete len:255 (+) Transcript_94132:2421-3185(+)